MPTSAKRTFSQSFRWGKWSPRRGPLNRRAKRPITGRLSQPTFPFAILGRGRDEDRPADDDVHSKTAVGLLSAYHTLAT